MAMTKKFTNPERKTSVKFRNSSNVVSEIMGVFKAPIAEENEEAVEVKDEEMVP